MKTNTSRILLNQEYKQTESVGLYKQVQCIHQLPINIGIDIASIHTHTHKHTQTAIGVHVYWDEKPVKLRDTNFIFGIINVHASTNV